MEHVDHLYIVIFYHINVIHYYQLMEMHVHISLQR